MAKFSEGLEVLGTDGYAADKTSLYGVFEKSALENVWLPSTLKRIKYGAFQGCKNLKSISIPEKLEYIGKYCF